MSKENGKDRLIIDRNYIVKTFIPSVNVLSKSDNEPDNWIVSLMCALNEGEELIYVGKSNTSGYKEIHGEVLSDENLFKPTLETFTRLRSLGVVETDLICIDRIYSSYLSSAISEI